MITQAYYEVDIPIADNKMIGPKAIIPPLFLHVIYEENTLLSLKTTLRQPEENIQTDFTDTVYHQVSEYLTGKRKSFDISYSLHGTEFQQKVWHALEKIPYGEVRTYREIAGEIGKDKRASRAVGGACGKNPIWLIVPCHRVVGTNGSLTGYAGGLSMKEKLLLMEGAIYHGRIC